MRKIEVILLLSFLFSINFASAYIDPGVGVAVGTSIWTSIVAVFGIALAFLARIFIHPIKRAFKFVWGKMSGNAKK